MHFVFFFFFNDTATTEIYTLSLHDALPIFRQGHPAAEGPHRLADPDTLSARARHRDRKSTRLNSSHLGISYAVFCLKKKKETMHTGSQTSMPPTTSRCATTLSERCIIAVSQ